jgi:hypothetical protein
MDYKKLTIKDDNNKTIYKNKKKNGWLHQKIKSFQK